MHKELILRLKIWLKKNNVSAARMSIMLGYSSSNIISMWIKRGRIPEYQISKVEKIIRKKEREE